MKMKTVTFICAYCKQITIKVVRNSQRPKYCGQVCNTKKLSVKTYRMLYE